MRRAIGVIAMHILLGASVAEAGDRLSLYSDACWHREAGDLLGYRGHPSLRWELRICAGSRRGVERAFGWQILCE